MTELEQRLSQLREELDWPRTPDIARGVMARLEGEARAPAARDEEPARTAPRRTFPLARRSLALALVALLLLAGAAVAAIPGVRHAVLDFFGLRGATVERRSELPPAPPPGPLHLGTRVALEQAAARIRFTPVVPADLGEPDAAYVRHTIPGGELSLTYRPRPGLPRARPTDLGLLVNEFRGDLAPVYAGKIAGQATTVERLAVDGEPAIW